MLRIRLQKPGKSVKGRVYFKIVVAEMYKARDSKFVAQLGHYDPIHDLLKLDKEIYEKWVSKGAQPSEAVKALYKRCKKAAK